MSAAGREGGGSIGSGGGLGGPLLELRDLCKRFGGHLAVDHLSLAIAAGEFLTVLGASGSGKTTTLRLIAGFEQPTTGAILMDGVDLAGLPPFKRPVNTVFQQYALFPHMSVAENVGYGLVMRHVPRPEIAARVAAALGMVRMKEFAERAPKTLSGGQQQRVALARALVNEPRVLLLDEPLGALDLKLRRAMQLELKQLQQQVGITFIYVTHDQEEALTMSDRIALMRDGRLEQVGSPREMYDRPRTRYVADFIGETNLIEGTVVEERAGRVSLRIADRVVRVPAYDREAEPRREGERVSLSVRPESMSLAAGSAAPTDENVLPGTVTGIVYAGSALRVHLRLADGSAIVAHQSDGVRFSVGDAASVRWQVERGVLVRA